MSLLDNPTESTSIEPTNTSVEKPKFSFKTWYAINKDKLSVARKQKYYNDPEYRAKLKIQSEVYRKNKPKKARKVSTRTTIPLLCEAANCSPHTYRKYCQQGWIPVPDKRVVFTEKHVALLEALCTAAKDTKYMRHDREEYLKPFIEALINGWN